MGVTPECVCDSHTQPRPGGCSGGRCEEPHFVLLLQQQPPREAVEPVGESLGGWRWRGAVFISPGLQGARLGQGKRDSGGAAETWVLPPPPYPLPGLSDNIGVSSTSKGWDQAVLGSRSVTPGGGESRQCLAHWSARSVHPTMGIPPNSWTPTRECWTRIPFYFC